MNVCQHESKDSKRVRKQILAEKCCLTWMNTHWGSGELKQISWFYFFLKHCIKSSIFDADSTNVWADSKILLLKDKLVKWYLFTL